MCKFDLFIEEESYTTTILVELVSCPLRLHPKAVHAVRQDALLENSPEVPLIDVTSSHPLQVQSQDWHAVLQSVSDE